jgi:hypothetical protein
MGFGGVSNGFNRISGGTGTTDGLYIMSATGRDIAFRTNGSGTTSMLISSGGNVLINTTDATKTRLLLNAEGNFSTSGNMTSGLAITNGSFGRALNMGIFESGAYGWIQAAYVNNADTTFALALQPRGGNVGIGTSSPSATLHVNSVGSNSGNSGIVERIRNGYYIGFTARSISSNTNVFKLTGFAPVNSVAGAAVVRVLISGTKTGNDTYASIYEYTILRSGQSALNVVEQRNIGRGGLAASVVGNEVIFTLVFGSYNEALINVEVLSINGELGNEPAVSLQFI